MCQFLQIKFLISLRRLCGHRDQITAIQFLYPSPDLPSTSSGSVSLLTVSKDTFLKVWELSTQHCVQTIVAHRADIWAMALDPSQRLLFTGSGEGELKVWNVDHDALAGGLKVTDNGEVCISHFKTSSLIHQYRW